MVATATSRRLKTHLDHLADTFGREHLTPDPLEVVLGYDDPRDVEVVGFLAAALAFGSARGAVAGVRDLLSRLGAPPAEAVGRWDAAGRPRLDGWRHRWLGPADASAVLGALGAMLRDHGSLEAFFAAGDDGGPIGDALASFVRRARALAPDAPPRFAYWFAGPARGGASKRLCLFLRWMCRRDGLDPGPWRSVEPSRLVIPLDTHVARISRYVGLARRRTTDWKAALEITAALREMDPADPVRYDYALCRLGILRHCPRRRDPAKCRDCPLLPVCLL